MAAMAAMAVANTNTLPNTNIVANTYPQNILPLKFPVFDNTTAKTTGIYAYTEQNTLKLVTVDRKSTSSKENCWICLDSLNNVEQISQSTQRAILGHLPSASKNEQSPVHLVHQECHEQYVKSKSAANLSKSIVNPWPDDQRCGSCQMAVDDQHITPSQISSKTAIDIALLATTCIGRSLIQHLLSSKIDKFVRETHPLPGINSSNPLVKYGVLGLWSLIKGIVFNKINNKVTSLISPYIFSEDSLELMIIRNSYSKKQYSDLAYRKRRFNASYLGFRTFKLVESYLNFLYSNSSQTSIPKTLIFSTDLFISNWFNIESIQISSMLAEFSHAASDEITLSNPLAQKKIMSLFTIPDLETSVSKQIFPIDQILNGEISYTKARSDFTGMIAFSMLVPTTSSPDSFFPYRMLLCLLEKEAGRRFCEATKKAFQANNQSTEEIDEIEGIIYKQNVLLDGLCNLIEKNNAKNNPAFTKKLQELIVASPHYNSAFNNYNTLLQNQYNLLNLKNENQELCKINLKELNEELQNLLDAPQDSDDELQNYIQTVESEISKMKKFKDELDKSQIESKSSLLDMQEIIGLTDTSKQLLGYSGNYFLSIFVSSVVPFILTHKTPCYQTTVNLEKETEIALRELIKETLGYLESHYSKEGQTATGL